MRFLVVLCLAVAASAPTLAYTALERRQSIDYFATAVVLAHTHGPRMLWSAASAYLDNGPRLAAVAAEGLLMAAAEPFLRRHIYVPGELRFSFARLNSLLSSGGLNVGDVVSNVYSSFRFRLAHLPRLLDALRIPSSFVTRGGCRFSGEEGLLILLNRLHFPGTLADLGQEAGRLPCALSECFGWMIEYIFSTFSHLCDWRSLAVHADNFPRYADAIHARGAPLRVITGFIDGGSFSTWHGQGGTRACSTLALTVWCARAEVAEDNAAKWHDGLSLQTHVKYAHTNTLQCVLNYLRRQKTLACWPDASADTQTC